MLQGSMLEGAAFPEAFECRVRGRMALPHATLELHDYRFGRPQQAVFESHHAFLDLALSHRPGDPQGRYGAERSRPMGDVIFIPAEHRLSSEWGAGAQSSICCQFEVPPPDDRTGWTPDELDASLDVRSPFVREALLRLAREIEQPGFGSELMAEALCTQLAIELGRYFRATRSTEEETGGRLSAAQLRHIEERLETPGRPPSIAELALECGLSTRHFFRIFKATTGTTLTDFATERRVVRARSLLADRGPAIKQVAWQCGFETAAAFSAAFRRATGISPRAYRRHMTS
ncbi:MAG: AraC family transcriptional regulator [Sphingomonas bacterium]|nr:AraC family transcriptional regulator [Sphingomonas bacterium]